MEILLFGTGVLFFYTHSVLAPIALIIAVFFKASRACSLWFFAGVILALVHQIGTAEVSMPRSLVLDKAHLQGEIISIPAVSDSKNQFQFRIQQLNHQPVQSAALLNCYVRCPEFKVGERWAFEAKLKRPQNLKNPGHFDYVRKLNANHLYWTGYLKAGSYQRIKQTTSWFFQFKQWREYLGQQIRLQMPDQVSSGIVQALTVGLTNQINSDEWDLFRRTGTTHLMVISGAHIGLVAGLFFFTSSWLWRRSARLCLYCPAQQAASIMAIFAAGLYAMLAGFAIPAERALIACVLLLGNNIFGRRLTGWQAWRYGLFFVIIIEPHAALMPGFYLSFGAVALLIASSQRLTCEGIPKLMLLQLMCLLGLMPMTLYWFSYSAINGFIANLIAIPFVGYLLVPLSLLSVLLIHVQSLSFLFVLLHYLIIFLLKFLYWVDTLSAVNLEWTLISVLDLLALMLIFVLLVFFPNKKIWPALSIIMLSIFIPRVERPAWGDAKIDVLDVGQGLAVAVQTAHHSLLYDTGGQFYKGGDMGQFAVLPYLRYYGINRLDGIIISHPDLDHRGGLASIEKKVPIDNLIVNDVDFYHRGNSCHHYADWAWDGVQFHFFPITDPNLGLKNNNSCVLKITSGRQSILLTGDIEREGEHYLLNQYPYDLRANALVVAHHGSKTSSGLEFIQHVAPQYAIISAGFDNRFHFPHQQTLDTLSQVKVAVLNTADCGLINITLTRKGPHLIQPHCQHLTD